MHFIKRQSDVGVCFAQSLSCTDASHQEKGLQHDCSVMCPSHVDNDRTIAHGISTSGRAVICPIVSSLFRPTARGFFQTSIDVWKWRISLFPVRETVSLP